MIGSPRYLAIQAATKATTQKGDAVADAAITELADYKRAQAEERATIAEAKLREVSTKCARCRTHDVCAIWNEIRLCDDCSRMMVEKYDRQPVPVPGRYTEGFEAGRRHAFQEAMEWLSDARKNEAPY